MRISDWSSDVCSSDLDRYVSAFRNDPGAFEDQIGQVDPGDPNALARLQDLMGSPDVILGAITSPEQHALRPQLEALVAVVAGVVDHVPDEVGAKLIPSYPMLTAALRRRPVAADASARFVERPSGLEPAPSPYDRGEAFVDGVLERAGREGLPALSAPPPHRA